MAVETKFVVVRKGEEKMTFANKKEADAYDKMLDMAEAFTDWLLQHQPALDESQAETLGLLIAEQKDAVQHILRTSKLPEAAVSVSQPEAVSEAGADDQAEEPAARKVRAVKAA
ncbi:YebG family protein [Pantoea sp. PNT01]|jgi:dsDNA-binding SOS-regulon protein|uniref:DNA damage-inducible SOS regulon protein n=1 Tax=Pantoea eucalypti TaxID=470933 RepID=A0ABY2ZM47_9GAMM|nr:MULTISPECIES: YebG family protein [Pantoea]PQL27686.1 DNA damage-inducible SOS regulon protein [Pantoea ananatis]QXG56969.1 YebG family protein [Pantoea jilinensis]AWP35108.1 DNA damage-inducible SOS regulon protein [Pantoea vagans]MBD9552780.1 YebG family protein [Pantoea sp. PNT01]MCD2357486.1 YebG family protein [Pantoea sp. MHSD4]